MSNIKSVSAGKLAEELVNRIHRAKEDSWEAGVELGKAIRRAESADDRAEELTGALGESNEARCKLRDRVEELLEENSRLEQEAQAGDLRISRLTKERDDARERADQEAVAKWVRIAGSDAWKARVKQLEDAIDDPEEGYAAARRVIRPGQMREGQTVAAELELFGDDEGPGWEVFRVEFEQGEPWLESEDATVLASRASTIVLLAGGPAPF